MCVCGGGGGGRGIATEAKRPRAKRPGGKRRLAEEMVLGGTTLILDGKIIMCFTHYKINLRQTLELIEDAFRKP